MKEETDFYASYGNEALEKVQSTLWEILLQVDSIFEKNDIRYFLSYGTLLGAVRHKGFIPWDDDLDICVFEEDYVKGIQLLREQLDHKYIVHDEHTDAIYWCPFSKLRLKESETECVLWPEDNKLKFRGICLDVFRCWKVKRSSKFYLKMEGYFEMLNKCFRLKAGKRNILLPYYFIMWSYYTLVNCFWGKEQWWCDPATLCAPVYTDDLLPLKKGEFNGKLFPIPNHPEKILRSKYGDFMSYPPLKDRTQHYSRVIFK